MFVAALIAAFGEAEHRVAPPTGNARRELAYAILEDDLRSRAVFEGRGFVRRGDAPAAHANLSRPRFHAPQSVA